MDQEVRHVVVEAGDPNGGRSALRRAGQEAVRHGARLCPVLVRPPARSAPPGGPRPPLPEDETLETWADWLRSLDAALGTALGGLAPTVDCDPLVAWGSPGPAMVAAAEREGDDTLLVVRADEPGVRHLLGPPSTARYCLKHWLGPLLLVPADPPEGPAVGSGGGGAEAFARGLGARCRGPATPPSTGAGGPRG
ncbi:universal stress protein [Streptomyces lunalinharesii]|uniref:UspA domain-containing protein n=1 Tax=Streptomyces lunalinharesii TaxID=333384 RepID=A0ABN3RQW3_9ACTN